MKIHPLWFICILVRLILICLIIYLNKKRNKKINIICTSVLFLMGLGFMYKGLTGSNNETQINKVFSSMKHVIYTVCFIYCLHFIFLKIM